MMIFRKTAASKSGFGDENVHIGIKMIHDKIVEDSMKNHYDACDESEVEMITSLVQLLLLQHKYKSEQQEDEEQQLGDSQLRKGL